MSPCARVYDTRELDIVRRVPYAPAHGENVKVVVRRILGHTANNVKFVVCLTIRHTVKRYSSPCVPGSNTRRNWNLRRVPRLAVHDEVPLDGRRRHEPLVPLFRHVSCFTHGEMGRHAPDERHKVKGTLPSGLVAVGCRREPHTANLFAVSFPAFAVC